eukprot:augustus_masked-scaffold_9-processed-gene-0.53-mRNA-1 protein AED:0.29 eAED:1.00 QI:0/-1/0/1/-1/1/1/0/171
MSLSKKEGETRQDDKQNARIPVHVKKEMDHYMSVLKTSLFNVEQQISTLEQAYFESTTSGNVVVGWENFNEVRAGHKLTKRNKDRGISSFSRTSLSAPPSQKSVRAIPPVKRSAHGAQFETRSVQTDNSSVKSKQKKKKIRKSVPSTLPPIQLAAPVDSVTRAQGQLPHPG